MAGRQGGGRALQPPPLVLQRTSRSRRYPYEIWQICAEASLPEEFANSAKPVPLMVKMIGGHGRIAARS